MYGAILCRILNSIIKMQHNMITNLKIKATPVKGMPMDAVLQKLEKGKTITGLNSGDRHLFKLEMETDLDTCKKLVEYVQQLGKATSQGN